MVEDLRYTLRTLARQPAFALTAILALALGIGANTAVFSAVNGILLKPLPFEDSSRLVSIWSSNPTIKVSIDRLPDSIADILDVRAQNRSFEKVAGYGKISLNLLGAGDPVRVYAIRVMDEFFPILGVQPFLGRTIGPDDDQPGRAVVVLNHAFWRDTFGADPAIIGTSINLSGKPYEVIGVMPPGFAFPRGSELPPFFGHAPETQMWVPAAFTPAQKMSRNRTLAVLARLRPGVTIEQARDDAAAIASRLAVLGPNEGFTKKVVFLKEQLVADIRPALWLLFAATSLVLLIGCANVANLLLARAVSRRREIALRAAMGAGRGRIIRQLLLEGAVLAGAGGALGVWAGYLFIRLLVSIGPAALPRLNEVGLGASVVAYAVAISIATGLLFALAPAVLGSAVNLADSMKRGGDKGASTGRTRARGAIVVAEVALSVVLLVSAALLLRSFWELRRIDAGFSARSLLTFETFLPPSRTASPDKVVAFYRDVLAGVRALPGVTRAGGVSHLPLANEEKTSAFVIEGQTQEPNEEWIANAHIATEGYFETMGVPLRRGRYFADGDSRDAPPVAIINETMAARFFPGQDPIGRHIRYDDGRSGWSTIVGVVADVRHSGLETAPIPQIYRPYAQDPHQRMVFLLEAPGDPLLLTAAVRKAVSAVDAEQPVSKVRTIAQVRAESIAARRLNTTLLAGLAVIALVLTVLGLYSVIAYAVSRRTREIGVRMALGAGRASVLRMIVGQGLALAALGLSLGVAASIAVTRFLASLLYGVTPLDLVAMSATAVLMLGVAAAACYIPARRAARVDPVVALRCD